MFKKYGIQISIALYAVALSCTGSAFIFPYVGQELTLAACFLAVFALAIGILGFEI